METPRRADPKKPFAFAGVTLFPGAVSKKYATDETGKQRTELQGRVTQLSVSDTWCKGAVTLRYLGLLRHVAVLELTECGSITRLPAEIGSLPNLEELKFRYSA